MFLKIGKRLIRLDRIESLTLNPTTKQIEVRMMSGITYYSAQKFTISDAEQKLNDLEIAVVNTTSIDL